VFGTSYGLTWLTALGATIATYLFGLFVIVPALQRMDRAAVHQDGSASLALVTAITRVKRLVALELRVHHHLQLHDPHAVRDLRGPSHVQRPASMTTAIHWSGLALLIGALGFGLTIALISRQPVIGMTMQTGAAALALGSTALLLLALPAVYAVQAEASGPTGLVGHALLATGLLLVVVVAAPAIVHPTLDLPSGEHPLVFALGISLVVGLLLTAIATFQADVFPRPAAVLLLAATAGIFIVFFVAEFLPPIAGQISSALFGVLLAIAFAWMGVALWNRA
jgi:hypothetical protein